MKISKMGLFATPKSVKEIEDWIMQLPPQDQVLAWTAMGMTWNFISAVVEEVSEFGGDSYEHL